LALGELTADNAWVEIEHEGEPLPTEHRGSARLRVQHLYFWNGA
jgi:DMSO/TMAO reductase YedYZ molybdopterin-dependent catalytic subunit